MGTIKLKKSLKVEHLLTVTVHEGQRIGLFVRAAQTHSFFLGASSKSIKLSPFYSGLFALSKRPGVGGYSL